MAPQPAANCLVKISRKASTYSSSVRYRISGSDRAPSTDAVHSLHASPSACEPEAAERCPRRKSRSCRSPELRDEVIRDPPLIDAPRHLLERKEGPHSEAQAKKRSER